MRRSRAEAAATRAAAVEAAARLFRGRGVDAVGLKDVMAALGMTHGGFYRHFESKDALVAESLAAASDDSADALAGAAATAPGAALDAIIEQYLSPEHVAHPELGCPVAALASEIRREARPARTVFTRAVERTAGLLADAARGRARGLFTLAALVGGVALARAVTDRKLAAEILSAVRDALKESH